MKKSLLVAGAGGHAKVVIDLALRTGAWHIAGILDDALDAPGKAILGFEVVGPTGGMVDYLKEGVAFVVAIGANSIRERLQTQAVSAGLDAATFVHPAAVVAESVEIDRGAVVMAGAVVNVGARIGTGAIVNTGAVIDHDCDIGDYCHVAPGVRMCGSVSAGRRWLIGVGASIIPGVAIGTDCIIGAGAAVVGAVASGTRVVGVPARVHSVA